MQARLLGAIFLGKFIILASRFLKIGGGSAAPGYYALKVCPDLISKLGQQIPQTIVITGTNGKTTTARMLAHFAQADNINVIRNATGSNLERGIASALIFNSNILNGKLKDVDLAIWELDEAAFNHLVPQINPRILVFLNVFRDQLDRYGEVDTIVKKWSQTLAQVDPRAKIILNGDDQNLLGLKNIFKGKVQTFGAENHKIKGEKTIYQTEKGGLDYEARHIQHPMLDKTEFTVGKQLFTLPLPGIYHIYDFLAAFVCAQNLQISPEVVREALKNFSPAFGRVEKFRIPLGREGYIFLIKNPAGANQVLQTLKDQLQDADQLLFALNDNLADGTDVSWIWDASFEQLRTTSHGPRTICSGSRAEDLALRLKYAGFDPQSLSLESDLDKAFHAATRGLKGRLFILPTYTALLNLQGILAKSGVKKHYWKET